MSLAIKLYKTSSPENAITKTLTNEISLTGTLKENIEILNPVVMIKSSTNLSGYNYMYIPDFDRYYWLKTDIERDSIWKVSGNVDVLFSHKTEILNNNAVIERQANSYNLYLNDNIFKVYNKVNLVTKNFNSGFTRNGSYLLTVIG